MGYRSEWKLAISATTNTKLLEFIQWMSDYEKDASKSVSAADCMRWILFNEVDRSNTTVEFEDQSTKCSFDWDSVISDIIDRADNDEELDSAYARIGEECDDNDVRQGDYTYVYINRSISDIGYCDIPEGKEQVVAIYEDQKPQEEKCDCGKMKDVGMSCWWCGDV